MPGDEWGQQQHRPSDEDQHDSDDHVEVPLVCGDRARVIHHTELQHVASAEQEQRQRCEKAKQTARYRHPPARWITGPERNKAVLIRPKCVNACGILPARLRLRYIVLLAEQTHIVRNRNYPLQHRRCLVIAALHLVTVR